MGSVFKIFSHSKMCKCVEKSFFVSCMILSAMSAYLIGEIQGLRDSNDDYGSDEYLYVRQRDSFGRRRGGPPIQGSESATYNADVYRRFQPILLRALQNASSNQLTRVPYFLQVPRPQPPIRSNNPKSLEQIYSELFRPEISTEPKSKLPDLSSISKLCPRDAFFYSLNTGHGHAVDLVTSAILAGNSTSQRLNIARALRDSPDVHPKVWYYALTRVSLRDKGLRQIRKPTPVEVMPDAFISVEALQSAQKQIPGQQCISMDGSQGADNGKENDLWYFREDIQLNSYHFHWHLSYPANSEEREDRRGELFYYMHHNLLARYDAERLSNKLARLTALSISHQGAIIDEPYNAHLANAGQRWTDRIPEIPFWDVVNKSDSTHQIIRLRSHILIAQQRITDSITGGSIFTSGGKIMNLLSPRGVDLIGDILESNKFSVNTLWYAFGQGGLHNNGLVMLAHSMDPYFVTKAPPGPIADITTSLRDPIFYRWQTFVNDVFDTHKMSLRPYTPTGGDHQLWWPGITMISTNILPWRHGPPNYLHTFWNQKQYRFGSQYPTPVCAKHLDHEEFTYRFMIDNSIGRRVTATIRIFLAPRIDEFGDRLAMTAQRYLFFVMDIFTVNLKPGRNVIHRNSTKSSLTTHSPNRNQCGWPHHLLLPKGTPKGMLFDLFVIATNGDVMAEPTPAWPLCGDPLGLYPDGYPMGYPFDRLAYQRPNNEGVVPDLDAYVSGISNIGIALVKIFHRMV